MVDTALAQQTEDETTVAQDPQPTVQPASPTEPKTLPERYVESQEPKEGVMQGLAVDPYQKESEAQMRRMFQYRPEYFGMTQEPLGHPGDIGKDEKEIQLDAITMRQEELLRGAEYYYLMTPNDEGVHEALYFNDPNAPIEKKYRELLLNGGGYLEDYDQSGNQLEMPFALTTTREYERYTGTAPEYSEDKNIIQQAGEAALTAYSSLVEPTGHGDLEEVNNRLIEMNITNPIARTLAMRTIATGEYSGDMVTKGLKELQIFGMSIPKYMAESASFVTADVLANAVDAITGLESAESAKRAFAPIKNFLDFPELLGIETHIQERSGKVYNPELIEEIIAPRSLGQGSVYYGVQEGVLYGGWGTLRTILATRATPKFEKWLKETYGGDDIASSLKRAMRQTDPKTGKVVERRQSDVVRDYIKLQGDEKVQAKLAKDLDISFGMLVRNPGAERSALLKGEWDALSTKTNETLATIRAARSRGRDDIVKTQRKVLADLRKQKQQFLHGKFVGKYHRDLYAEAGMTIGATVVAQQLSQEFFGFKQSDMLPIEIGGAMSAVVRIPFTGGATSTDVGVGTLRALGGVFNEVHNLYKNFGSIDAIMQGREGLKASREAMKLLRAVAKQPSEFQSEFINGLTTHVELKNRLVELAAKHNVEIDENLFVSNLAIMSGMSELIDISRQLDEKITATGLADISGAIVQRREIVAGQQELLAQLAGTTQQLLDLRLKSDIKDTDPLAILSDQMREFVLKQQKRLDEDRQYVGSILANQREQLQLAIASDAVNSADNGAGVHKLLSETYEQEIEALADNLSDDVRGLMLNPMEDVASRMARIDELRQEQFNMLEQVNRGLRPGEAAAGRAGSQFANIVAYRRSMIDSEVAKRYMEFDSNNPDVLANVSGQFDYLMGSSVDTLDDVLDPDYVLSAANELAGYKMIPSDRSGFARLYDGGAKRGLAYLNKYSDGQLGRLLEQAELSDAAPIKQWVELRRMLVEEPDTLGLSPEQGANWAKQLPMLINTKEWRKINKHLGKTMRKSTEEKQQKYMALYDQWQLVGKETLDDGSENIGVFKSGWFDGNPQIVGPEVYQQFRDIQRFYRQEVIERYAVDKQIKGWDSTITTGAKGKATGPMSADEQAEQELLQDFMKEFSKVDEGQMPVKWLDTLLARVEKESANNALSGMELNDKLYTSIGRALGKVGGHFDPQTGKYVLLSGSADANDELLVKTTEQLRTVLTRHLQGILVKDFNAAMPTNARGEKIFTPTEGVKYNENMFKSLFNIELYVRNADGSISPSGEKLLDEEEIFSAIDLSSLERNRLDLVDTFKQAEKQVDKVQDDVLGSMGGLNKVQEDARKEITFIKDMQRNFFDIRSESGKSFTSDEALSETLYNMTIGREQGVGDIAELKRVMSNQGYDVDYIDTFIAQKVNDHIINTTQYFKGNKQMMTSDDVWVQTDRYDVSTDKIYKAIGSPDSDQRRRLRAIIGDDAVDTWELIAEVVRKMDPPASSSGADVHVSSMSLDSILSRIYNINRGVVSVQWVATESIIRAGRQHSGALLRTMLQDKEVAREVLKIVEEGRVPEFKTEPKFLRALTAQTILSEMRNEYSASDEFASAWYGVTGFERLPTNLEYAGIDEAVEPEPEQEQPTQQPKTDLQIQLESMGLSTQPQPTQQGATQ